MFEVEFLSNKNRIKEHYELSKIDWLSSLEKLVNKLVMQAIKEMRDGFSKSGFDYDYFELKAMVLNMFYVDVENEFDVESMNYKTNIVLKPRPTPISRYNRDNCSNYDLKLLFD